MISIDEWKKVELKTANVISVEKIEGSEKLLKLLVSLGDEERQIIAGIGEEYSPKSLIGKQIVVVANLKYKKLMGFESQGMLVAATDETGKSILIVPEQETAPGSLLS